MDSDTHDYFRELVRSYSDSIRASDVKANIIIVAIASLLSPLFFWHDKLNKFSSLSLIVVLLFLAILSQLISLYPRYPENGFDTFPVLNKLTLDNFPLDDTQKPPIRRMQLRCVTLGQILYWKTLFIRAGLAFFALALIISLSTIIKGGA